MPDYVIKVSMPTGDMSGATAAVTSMEKIEQTAESVTTGATGAAAATDRLAQAAARTPNAPLESLATSAQKAAGNIQHASEATGRFVDQAGRLREANGQFVSLGNAAKETEGILSKMELGFGIGFGEKALGGLEEIGHHVTEFFEKGIEGNAELQTSIIGLGATLRSVQPEKFLSFEAAQREGSARIDMLRDKANSLGVGMTSLVEAYSANMRALIEGGVTNPEQQAALVATFAQAEMSKGVTGMQALRDSIDTFNGRVGNITIAKELGLTEKGLKDATEQGKLYQYVMGTLPGYQEAAAASADSFTGSLTTIRNELDKLAQDAAKPAFDKILALMQGGRGMLGSTEASGDALGVGNLVGGVLDGAEKITAYFDAHPWLKKLYGLEQTYGLGGVMTGRPLWQPLVDQNMDAGQADAEASAQSKLVKELQEKIANAKDDKAVAEARKALEDAIAAATQRTAAAQGEAKDRAQEFLLILQDIERTFGGKVGHAPVDTAAAEKRAKQDADAYAKYNARPAASAGGDLAAVASADKQEKAIDAFAKSLEKTYQFTEATAHKIAEETVKRAENTKAAAALNKELDATIAKTDRLLSSSDLSTKLQGIYGSILGQLPEGSRGGLGTAPTNENLFGVSEAVEGMPAGDQKALEAKKALADLIREATHLQEDYNAAVAREGRDDEREQRDADEAAKNRKQTQDVIADEQAETAILAARGRGQKDVADALEKQRDILRETTRLQSAGVEYAEALRLATERINAANAASDEKQAERAQRREDAARRHEGHEQEHHRRGERETYTIHGYHDPNQDRGGLHTGGLSTGGLSTGSLDGGASSDRFGGRPDAAAARLAKHTGDPDHDPAARLAKLTGDPDHDPMARLGKAPAYVPSFKTLEESAKSLGVWRGGPADMFPAPTAAAAIGATIPTLAQPAGGVTAAPVSAPGTGDNVAGAAQSAYNAGQQALSAAKQSAAGAGKGGDSQQLKNLEHDVRDLRHQSEELKKLETSFRHLEQEFQEVKTQVSNLEGQNKNRA